MLLEKLSFPAAPLVGAGVGALGGLVTSSPDNRMSSIVGGGVAGALTGGVGKAGLRKLTGKGGFRSTLRREKTEDAVKGALINTGVSAVANKLVSDKHPGVRAAAPYLDDAVAAGLMLAKV